MRDWRVGRKIGFVCRRVRGAQRVGETRPAAALCMNAGSCHSGIARHFLQRARGSPWRATSRSGLRSAHRPARAAAARRLLPARRRNRDAPSAAWSLKRSMRAADDALASPSGSVLLQIIGMGVEEDEFDQRRVVGTAHAIGLAAVARRQVVEHVQRHRRDAPGLGVDQLRPIGAVDHARTADRRSDRAAACPQRARSASRCAARRPAACAFRRKGERESRAA